jgi:PAS domain S-box-containing protein
LTLAALALVAHRIFTPLVQRMRHDLQRHERHAMELEKLFSVSPSAMFIVDAASLSIVRGNRKAEALLGCSADELVGRPFSAFFDPRLEANKQFIKKIRAGEVLDEYEVLLVGAKQNLVEALASSRQLADAKQRGYLIAVTDITAIHRPMSDSTRRDSNE